MLQKLSVQHYKSIESLNLDLGEVTILVGSNATGKSNVVDALRFIKDAARLGVDHAVSVRHGIETIRQWSSSRPYDVSIECEYTHHLYAPDVTFPARYSITLASSRGQHIVKREEGDLYFTIRTPGAARTGRTAKDDSGFAKKIRFERKSDGTAEHLHPREDEPRKVELEDKDDLFLRSLSAVSYRRLLGLLRDFESYSIYPNTLRNPTPLSNEEFLLPDGSNWCSIFRRMRKNKAAAENINEIITAMRYVIPNLDAIQVRATGGILVPQFFIREKSKVHVFNVMQLSDGTLRVLGILMALYQVPRPSVIALEEPELSVNPGIIGLLCDAIKEVSAYSQIIVTTHSPYLIDQFEPDCIRAVEYENGTTLVRPIAKTQVEAVRKKLFSLSELMVSEGLRG